MASVLLRRPLTRRLAALSPDPKYTRYEGPAPPCQAWSGAVSRRTSHYRPLSLPLLSLGILCRMLHSVIPAGGSGTRLWPLSRADNPKFLHPLTGSDLTLIQSTVARLAPLSDAAHRYVVTGTAHAAAVARQLPELPESNILVEPSPRDSAAAIALAAAVIAERDPNALMGSFAADHLIADAAGFAKTVEAAMEMAADGLLMTIGITPTGPDTSYGYLRRGEALGAGNLLQEFKEKPDHVAAVEYVSSGDYLWNASMFVWRVDVFLAELNRQRPHLHDTVRELAGAWDSPRREELFGKLWPELEKISVDYAVMEGAAAAGKVGVVPGDFGWNDVGDFDTLGAILPPHDDSGNVVISTGAEGVDVLTLDARRNVLVPGSGRLVATVGTDDLIIVDTPDALLVCPRDRAQDVKKLVDELKNRGDTGLV
ncbi:Mannose-1-phosphate guanylyltransferase [Stackebrandtia nassauensis DSM 44728]|uniref:Mannose-1-phosphate guanylyltransferase n=2 Tax=Stackebrandtia TaxID=283810 RepID=D3Q160_STANL|nr:Mannose-1-phosphate guanylyltransferase [Stackebrandtia nassauensis DSM 44728]